MVSTEIKKNLEITNNVLNKMYKAVVYDSFI